MSLSKQSIRQGVHVLVDGVHATKEELITLSETWTEKRELFFRKMLQQGGNFKMDGKEFVVKIPHGNLSVNLSMMSNKSTVLPIPGSPIIT